MKKLEVLKGIAEVIVSIGVGSIVGNAIKITTDPDTSRWKRISIGIGGFVLSSMVSNAATEYTSQKIDETADKLKKAFNGSEEIETWDPIEVDMSQFYAPEGSHWERGEDGVLSLVDNDEAFDEAVDRVKKNLGNVTKEEPTEKEK